MRSPAEDASRASTRYFSMACRALPRTAGPLFPFLWVRGFPLLRPLPPPCVRFALGPCLVLFNFKLIIFLEVQFRPPIAISDQSPSLRTTSLDDWYGGRAVSSRLLVAQHLLAVSVDHRTKWLLSHAFNSLRNALTSNQVGGIEALGELAGSGCEQFTGAWLHILPI